MVVAVAAAVRGGGGAGGGAGGGGAVAVVLAVVAFAAMVVVVVVLLLSEYCGVEECGSVQRFMPGRKDTDTFAYTNKYAFGEKGGHLHNCNHVNDGDEEQINDMTR